MRLPFDRIYVAAILSAEGDPTEVADDADGGGMMSDIASKGGNLDSETIKNALVYGTRRCFLCRRF